MSTPTPPPAPDGGAVSYRPTEQLPSTNVAAHSHDQLKGMIDAAQPGAASTLGSEWVRLSGELQSFADDMRAFAHNTEARWEGMAGDAARGALLALADWSSATAEGIGTMSSNVGMQSDAAGTAQLRMPDPVPYDRLEYLSLMATTTSPLEWAMIVAEARQQYDAHVEAEYEAQRIVAEYSTALHETASTMPAFAPPPTFGSEDPGTDPTVDGRPSVPGGSGAGVPATQGTAPVGQQAGPLPTPPQLQPAPAPGPVPPTGPVGPGSPSPYPPGPVPPSGPGYPVPPGGSRTPGGAGPGRPVTGRPVTGRPGPGGLPGGQGGRGGFGPSGGLRAGGPGFGPGGSSGFGPGGSGGSGGAGARGVGGFGPAGMADDGVPGRGAGRGAAAGGGGYGPMAGAGAGRDEDRERRRPSYLVECEDVWGDGELVAPPVIGEAPPAHYRRG